SPSPRLSGSCAWQRARTFSPSPQPLALRPVLLPVDIQHVVTVEYLQEPFMKDDKADILRGTLDLLILKTLDTLGPVHGYGVAQRIQQVSGAMLSLNQGTLYPALLRLEQRGWIRSRMGVSDNNRQARFY